MKHQRQAQAGHDVWYGIAVLPAGLPAAMGAWRTVRHCDGILPSAALSVSGVLRARRRGADT